MQSPAAPPSPHFTLRIEFTATATAALAVANNANVLADTGATLYARSAAPAVSSLVGRLPASEAGSVASLSAGARSAAAAADKTFGTSLGSASTLVENRLSNFTTGQGTGDATPTT